MANDKLKVGQFANPPKMSEDELNAILELAMQEEEYGTPPEIEEPIPPKPPMMDRNLGGLIEAIPEGAGHLLGKSLKGIGSFINNAVIQPVVKPLAEGIVEGGKNIYRGATGQPTTVEEKMNIGQFTVPDLPDSGIVVDKDNYSSLKEEYAPEGSLERNILAESGELEDSMMALQEIIDNAIPELPPDAPEIAVDPTMTPTPEVSPELPIPNADELYQQGMDKGQGKTLGGLAAGVQGKEGDFSLKDALISLGMNVAGASQYGPLMDILGKAYTAGGGKGYSTPSTLYPAQQARELQQLNIQRAVMGQAPVAPTYTQDLSKQSETLRKEQLERQEKIDKQAGWGNTPDKARDEISALIVADKGLDAVGKNLDFAIKTGDLTTMSNAITQLMGISSVLLEQGVVTDDETQRNLAGMMADLTAVQADGSRESAARYFSSESWNSSKNALAVAKSQAQARVNSWANIYPEAAPKILSSYGGQIDIFANTPSTQPSVPSKDKTVTQEYADVQRALGLIANAEISGLGKVGEVSSLVKSGLDLFGLDLGLNDTLGKAAEKLRNKLKELELSRGKVVNPKVETTPRNTNTGGKPTDNKPSNSAPPAKKKKTKMVKNPVTGKWEKKEIE